MEPHYRRLLAEMVEAQLLGVNVNCAALYGFSDECRRLYEQLIRFPQEVRLYHTWCRPYHQLADC